jgi:hypothetical protein
MRTSVGVESFVKLTDTRGRSTPGGGRVLIETDKYTAAVQTEGYVSGVAAGSFVDKVTGARDLGFGLSVVDFLLEPADPREPPGPGQYEFNTPVHGRIAKRYVETPQICTGAMRLNARAALGNGFAVVRQSYRWSRAYPPHELAGSVWEQTLVFPQGERFFLSSDRVTTVSTSPELFLRIDMPGHIKHKGASGFEHVYLSYNEPQVIPSTDFVRDFAPDERFLYRRGVERLPQRFIRAYQVQMLGRREGPWLAGITLHPADVYQAWCHERGYVCLIEEIGGHPTKPGDTFGACYLIGWFNDLVEMDQANDRFKGISGLAIEGPPDRPTRFRGLNAAELTPVTI